MKMKLNETLTKLKPLLKGSLTDIEIKQNPSLILEPQSLIP